MFSQVKIMTQVEILQNRSLKINITEGSGLTIDPPNRTYI